MSKENLFWKDEKGQLYYFDYPVDVQTPSPEKVSRENNTPTGQERSGKGVSEATPKTYNARKIRKNHE